MSEVSLTYLASAQKDAGGTSIVVESTNTDPVVSFSYIVFSGDNADSSTSGQFENRNVNVGSDKCFLVSTDTVGEVITSKYHLFVENYQI